MIEYGWPVPCAARQFVPKNSDPMAMGRSVAACDASRTYTETIGTVLNDAKTAGNGLNTALKK